MSSFVDRALRRLPTVYFYVPGVRREMGKRAGVAVTEDMCAVLWLIESATVSWEGALQVEVRKAVGLTNARMSKVLRALSPAFVTRALDTTSLRNHRLTLTPKGKELLAVIKEEREAFLTQFFNAIAPQERTACIDALTTLDSAMWHVLRKEPDKK